MPDESTLLTDASADPKAGAAAAASGDPNATPKGDAGKPADPAAPAKPDGSSQDPTKPKDGEGKPAEGQDPKPPAPKPAAAVVPEKYADFTVPEGVELNPADVGEFTNIAKELKLTQEQAQKLVDLQTKAVGNMAKDTVAQFDAMKDSWKQDTLKLLGPDANKQLALAAAARDKFGTEALKTFLDESGLGSHPAVVQFFISVGKGLSEDTFAEGKTHSAGGKSHAEVLYPTNK